MEWMRASASMPLVSSIVKIDGGSYLDGAITDSIPLRFMHRQGYERNVVILTRPRDYRKKPENVLLLKTMLRDYPAMIRVMDAS